MRSGFMNNIFMSFERKDLSAKEFAYLEIKYRIIKGELSPNEQLLEIPLSKSLKISRTPLREAIYKLEFEGLVVRQNNNRLKVAPISIKEVIEIFTVRCKLEEIAVEEATERAKETDLFNLESIVTLINNSYKNNQIDQVLYYGEKF